MSTTTTPDYAVRAVHCHYEASDDDVYEALKRATDPLTDAWDKLRRATRIGIKFNQDKRPADRVYFEGQLQQLVSAKVVRAVLRLLRERTDADLVCADVSYYAKYLGADSMETPTVLPILREFDVEYIDGTKPPYKTYQVPGGGTDVQTVPPARGIHGGR